MFNVDRKKYYWNIFRKYHYLNHSLNEASSVYVATCNGHLCGFSAVLAFPHPIVKNTFKEHRTVILPDYQGIGIGTAFTDFVADIYKKRGCEYISTTSSPSMIAARRKNPKWITTRRGRLSSGSDRGKIQNKNKKNSTSCKRISVSFKYKG